MPGYGSRSWSGPGPGPGHGQRCPRQLISMSIFNSPFDYCSKRGSQQQQQQLQRGNGAGAQHRFLWAWLAYALPLSSQYFDVVSTGETRTVTKDSGNELARRQANDLGNELGRS